MKIFKLNFLLALLVGLFVVTSCGDDEEPTGTGDTVPVSSFQFMIDATDFNKVTFTNFSKDATSYVWDFGDGNTSADENPTHTYAAAGDYTVNMTASNATSSHTSTKVVTIVDPNSAIEGLTGETSKVWKLSRNIADMEYPMQGAEIELR